jgi:hypothetical protein
LTDHGLGLHRRGRLVAHRDGRAALATGDRPVPGSQKSNDIVAKGELGRAHLTTYLHVLGSPSQLRVLTWCFLQLTIAPRTATALLSARAERRPSRRPVFAGRHGLLGPEPDGLAQIPLVCLPNATGERGGDSGGASS